MLTVESRPHDVGDVGQDSLTETIPVFTLTGDMDVHTGPIYLAPALQEAFEKKQARSLIIDVSGVSFMDSAGFGILMRASRRAMERGGKVILVAPKPPVARALKISALDRFLLVADTVAQARDFLKGS